MQGRWRYADCSDVTSDQSMQRYASTMSMEWRDYEDFMEKYGYNHPEKFSKWTSRFFLYETMGILLKSEVVKAEKLYALGGYVSIRVWEKFKDIIQSRRDAAWGLDYMINFEYVAEEMLKIKTKHDTSFKDKLETYRRTGKL
jgi:hypothetical protein